MRHPGLDWASYMFFALFFAGLGVVILWILAITLLDKDM